MVKSESGQSLIGVLVSIAITGVVLAVNTAMNANMQRETQALTEKLAALDLQKAATAALADGSVCKHVLSPVKFNADLVPTAANPIKLQVPGNILYASVSGVAPAPVITGPVLASAGGAPSGLTNNLKVTSIELELNSKSGTTFIGNFVINFDNNRLIRPIHPVRVLASVTASGPGVGATIASCAGAGGGSGAGETGSLCGFFSVVNGSLKMTASCQGLTTPSCVKLAAGGSCAAVDVKSLCPSGYTVVTLSSSSTAIPGSCTGGGYGPQTCSYSTTANYSCVKI